MSQEGLRRPEDDDYACRFCGGRRFKLIHSWEVGHPRNSARIPLGYWQCDCQLAFLYPVPDAADLPHFGDWWSPERKMLIRRRSFKQVRVRVQNWLFGTAQQRLIQQTAKVAPGGKLLDIGCGQGGLLDVARSIYECEGLEPSERAVQVARAKGFQIHQATLEESGLPADSYDVVTLDAVLEHLLDPVATLKKIHQVLKPGGVVAIKVPKLWGPAHRMHGREWNGFRVAYHTMMFTGRTLDNCLHEAGLKPLDDPRRDRTLDDILVVWGRKAG